MNLTSLAKLAGGLSDFESRHLQVAADVHLGIPLQIRVMREARSWNQTQLGEKISTTQNAISRLESSDYGKPNVKTLLRLAEAFDVALLVKFVPFSRFAQVLDEMSETSIAVPSFDKDEVLFEMMYASGERDKAPSKPKPPGSASGCYADRDFHALRTTGTGMTLDLDSSESSGRGGMPPSGKCGAEVIEIFPHPSQERIHVGTSTN
jgi:transcriptional regulator with XRE-family HTH domain